MSPATILFFTNSELGQASVILAVAAEVTRVAGSHVHLGSFAPLAHIVPEGVQFHCLPGPSMKQVLAISGIDFLPRHRPGLFGASKGFAEAYSRVLAPWDASDYFSIYDACRQLIQDLKPDLVVLDPILGAAYDATTSLKCRTIILSPNTFKDHATASQPGTDSLLKLPCLGSGYSSPPGVLKFFLNICLLLSLHVYGHWSEPVKKLDEARRQRGISGRSGPIALFDEPPSDLVFLVQSVPESDFAMFVPPNLLGCGPILPSFTPLADTHVGLAEWIEAGPTIVINMGSHITYGSQQANQIMQAVTACMQRQKNLQVLWKLQTDDFPAVPAALASRLRILSWLPSTPAAILTASPSVCAYVYHGGSNSFHEALAAGVQHIVCPVWLDTYDFATRVEYLGIGLWANRKHAPDVDGASLEIAIEDATTGFGAERRLKEAQRLAKVVGGVNAGREFAANRVLDAAT
ncbi:hypothetical protein ACN47E_004897 [Coniothyrium glycines]